MFVYHAGTGTVIPVSECRVIIDRYSEYFLDNEPDEAEANKFGESLSTIIEEWSKK